MLSGKAGIAVALLKILRPLPPPPLSLPPHPFLTPLLSFSFSLKFPYPANEYQQMKAQPINVIDASNPIKSRSFCHKEFRGRGRVAVGKKEAGEWRRLWERGILATIGEMEEVTL